MPEFHYVSYAATGRHSHELIEGSPFAWLLNANTAGYEDAPYILLHSFPITEAEYLEHRTKFV